MYFYCGVLNVGEGTEHFFRGENMYAVVAMNRSLFSWQARFCQEQNPLWALW